MVKNPPAEAGDAGLIPGSGRSAGGGNGILAWKIPRTEEPGELQSMGSQTVRPNLANQRRQQHLLKSSITGHLNFCSLDTAKKKPHRYLNLPRKKKGSRRSRGHG